MKSQLLITICCPDRSEAELWGDYHFARALGEAFAEHSFEYHIAFLYEWETEPDTYTLHIHIRGQQRYTGSRKAKQNLLWHISHPETVSTDEYLSFDFVGVASSHFAEKMKRLVSTYIFPLLQATSFAPAQKTTSHKESSLLFVGNTRGEYREVVRYAMEAGIPLRVYGSGWSEYIDSAKIIANRVENSRLPLLYATAPVVLNDHLAGMKQYGFLSNRIFDVLAAGGLVYTDYVRGLQEVFQGFIPFYTGRYDFTYELRKILDDPDKYEDRRRQAHQLVQEAHTFANRVRQIMSVL
ncbi:MAG: glycosyltransferase [Patescibacteria group bacterium]|nr:glycosyltransferase [Patescibacteria group bacterium]